MILIILILMIFPFRSRLRANSIPHLAALALYLPATHAEQFVAPAAE